MNPLSSLVQNDYAKYAQNAAPCGAAPATLALDLLSQRLSHQIALASDLSDRLSAVADRLLGPRAISGATVGELPTECGMLAHISEMLDRFDRVIAVTDETASALESV